MNEWYRRDPARYSEERGFWTRNGFTEERAGGRIAFTGLVPMQVGADGGAAQHADFKVRVTYPSAFPYRPPTVEFIEPRVRGARHQSPAGEPCLFPPREWTQFSAPSEVHNALRRWLRGWMLKSFPRELALYELPEYFDYDPLSVLVTPETFGQFSGRERGTFSLTCASGRDLAVLKTVNNVEVARDLLDGLRLGTEVRQEVRNGRWFRLDREPPFVRTTGQLVEFLNNNGHTWRADRAPTQHGLVGLVFEDEVLREERLLLLDYSAQGKKARPGPQGWALRAPWVYPVSPQDLFRRLEGVHDLDPLQASNVVVLGAGAIGSPLLLDLAREGVGGFVICDPDKLRPGNVMRHALDLFAVGRFKAEAVELAAGRVNPYLETWSEVVNLNDPEVLANLMRSDHPAHPAALIISAIGDDAIEGLVSEVATSTTSAPVLFVRTLHDGDLVRMMLLRPGQGDACLECLRLHAVDGHPDFIDPPDGVLHPVFDAGCATAAQPGAGLASRQAAVFAAKRAVALMLGELGDANHWLWVDRAIHDAADPRLRIAEVMHSSRFAKHPDCPYC